MINKSDVKERRLEKVSSRGTVYHLSEDLEHHLDHNY